MDNKKIKSILQDALENEIPASQVDLVSAVRSHLVAGRKHHRQQGEKMNRVSMKRLAFSAITVLALLAAVLITPQGRAFAQSVLQLFVRAEDNTIPLEPGQVIPPASVEAATAMPPSPLISVAEAEQLAGFDAAELSWVPEGFNYLGARMYGNAISIEYEAQGGGGNLIIMQSRDGYVQSQWDQVPADAIVPVRIGGLDGEFAKGTFVVYGNDNVGTWNPDAAILRLRWVKDGVWYEMTRFGDVESIQYLDQAGMIALAESLK